ncbi:hypothetical protein H6G17_31010 [Chroococcidiopsis sp. FACHB-1243]|uniref:hypothetical protein n=1 Tax=Chroococcidiopsis sp. [FACHB-1243] TaxID=2692781 RepID=UPI00177B4B83|nr:hypothetical protein [Chroococcidiopsis sp. [FACHB-1243]]MBD2309845.1 hypothetical protein [Chroococcidiopsis sp. [FACHB-1243]]
MSLSRSIWFRLSIHFNFYIAKRVRKCDRLQKSAPLGVLQSFQQLDKRIMDLVFDDWLRQQELEAFRLANSTIATRACPTPNSTSCATASN